MSNKKITTPVGEASWCKINGVLDSYEGNVLGYSVRLKLNDEDTKALEQQLVDVLEEAKKDKAFEGKKWSTEPFMGISEDKEGNKVFKFKSKHEFEKDGVVTKITIPLFDAKQNRLPDDIQIGNGSKIKVSFTPAAFHISSRTNGLTLRLSAIQILDLIEYSGANAESFGFGDEVGYEAPQCSQISDDEIPF